MSSFHCCFICYSHRSISLINFLIKNLFIPTVSYGFNNVIFCFIISVYTFLTSFSFFSCHFLHHFCQLRTSTKFSSNVCSFNFWNILFRFSPCCWNNFIQKIWVINKNISTLLSYFISFLIFPLHCYFSFPFQYWIPCVRLNCHL